MINYDFITKIWNLKGTNVDLEKSYISLDGITQILHLYLINGNIVCPKCGSNDCLIKGSKIQTLKHSLIGGNASTIKFHKRIFKCNTCSKYFSERLDEIKCYKNISFATIFEILYSLRNLRLTYKDVSIKYNVSDTYVRKVFDKFVDIERHELGTVLSIDEVYSKKLTKTKYCCVLFNPLKNEIIDVLPTRRKNYLEDYLYYIPYKERLNVKYVVIDLYDTYKRASIDCFNNPIIAVDSFHVIENLNRYFRKIRIRVMKRYEDFKNVNDFNYWLLKKFYWILEADFDKVQDDFEFKRKDIVMDKYRIIYYMLEVDDELKRAYALKEAYREFNNYSTFEEAPDILEELTLDFFKSDIEEMRMFGSLLIKWKNEIINSFIRIDGWRLSNAKIERKNKNIKLLFSNAYGYTNFLRTRNRIMYSLNKNESILGEPLKDTNNREFKKRKPYKNK